jgi:hypothetical protein
MNSVWLSVCDRRTLISRSSSWPRAKCYVPIYRAEVIRYTYNSSAQAQLVRHVWHIYWLVLAWDRELSFRGLWVQPLVRSVCGPAPLSLHGLEWTSRFRPPQGRPSFSWFCHHCRWCNLSYWWPHPRNWFCTLAQFSRGQEDEHDQIWWPHTSNSSRFLFLKLETSHCMKGHAVSKCISPFQVDLCICL